MASRKTPKVPGSLTELRQRWAGAGRDDLLAKDVQAVAGQIPDSAASQILSFLGRELGVVELGDLLEHPRAQQAVRSAMKLADRTRFLAALNDLSASAPGEDGPTETRRWNARPPAELRAITAPRDPREVRAWLLGRDKAAGQALLDESASGLYWTVARRFRPAVERLNRETMGEVLDFRPTRTGFRADEIDHLRASVGAWAEAELRRSALKALRDETWNRRLDSPLQRVLSVRLQEARRTMLAEAEGLGAPDLEATVEIDVEPPSLHAEFRRAVMHSVDARLHVGGFEDAPLRWECRCRGTDGVACEHALALVEWALDALHDERHPLHAGMLSLVATPSWQRFLDDLDLRLPAAAEVGQKTRVVFRVETRDNPMTITPYLQKRSKSGVYSAGRKVKATQLLQKQDDAIAPEDQACLEALRAQSIAQRHAYATDAASRAMLALEGHPRVYLEHQPSQRIHVERVPLNISFEREDGGAARVRVRVGSTNVNLDTPSEATAARTVLAAVSEAESDEGGETTLHLARVGSRASALLDSLRAYPALVPEAAFDRLITLLLRLQPGVDLRLPVSMRGEQVEPDKRLVARLEPVGDEALRVSLLVRPAPGGPVWGPGTGGRQSYGVADGQRVFAMRDLHEERERADAGAERFGLHLALVEREHVFRVVHLDDALELLSALREAEDVVVEWPDGAMPWQVGAVAASSGLNVRVRRAVDWFSVEGEVEVEDGSVGLNTLLAAVRDGRRFVQLSKGRFARIEADLRQRLLALDSRVFKERDGLGAGAASLATIATIIEGPSPGADADADTDDDAAHRAALKAVELKHIDVDEEAFALIRDGLTHLDGDVPEPALPEELNAELRSYQRQGFDWLARLASWGVGGLLADEMGLGKTVQAIALLLLRKGDGPALVVAPTSVIGGWRNELNRFAPSLDVRVYHGSRRAQLLDGAGPGTVLLTSYDILARDAAPGSEDALRQLTFGLVVLDEAQAIKNPSTRRAKAAQALHRRMAVALTGTPLENHLGELWSLMRVVNPGLLGTRAHFRHRFSIPIEREGDDAAQDALRTLMQPFLLRRTKREVAPELPPRTEVVHSVELSEAERRLYDAARREALGQLSGTGADGEATEGAGEGQRFEVLAALMRLRRLACHPRLVHKDSTLKGAKLEAFMRLTRELREAGHRALVFSQFTSHLAIVQEALDLARVPTLYLDGSTPQQVREERVDAFQKGSVPFFLISLKAGGTGLNLTAADYVIHLDPWWNPAAEDQASDRAHRIGQDKPVTVVRLVAADTIEESVLALHEEKRELADRLLEGSGAAGVLSTEQLRALITGPR